MTRDEASAVLPAKDAGGSAFPNDGSWANGHPEGGLTIRDYFATQAMNGYLLGARSEGWALPNDHQQEYMARNAYAMADAMLAERTKGSDK